MRKLRNRSKFPKKKQLRSTNLTLYHYSSVSFLDFEKFHCQIRKLKQNTPASANCHFFFVRFTKVSGQEPAETNSEQISTITSTAAVEATLEEPSEMNGVLPGNLHFFFL